MITKEAVISFVNSNNNLISNLANFLTVFSFLGAAAIWFSENLDRFWPFVALLAITSAALMAICLSQAKEEISQVTDAFNSLYSSYSDFLSERMGADAKNNPEIFTHTRIAVIAGVLRTVKKDPKEIDKLIKRLSEIEHRRNE